MSSHEDLVYFVEKSPPLSTYKHRNRDVNFLYQNCIPLVNEKKSAGGQKPAPSGTCGLISSRPCPDRSVTASRPLLHQLLSLYKALVYVGGFSVKSAGQSA